MNAITLRLADPADASALLAIYAPYVSDTSITFEYTVPSLAEFTSRIQHTLEKYPYIAAAIDDRIIGYAYASAFKGRAAYDWAVETSIYVSQDHQGQGLGRRLYQALEDTLRLQNILNANACITYPNPASIAFHQRLGYKTVAHFSQCGYKLGRWHDMIWMEKLLAPHPAAPQPVIPLPQLASLPL